MSKVSDKLSKSKAQAASDAKTIKPLLKKYDLKTLRVPATPKTDKDFARVHLSQYRTLQMLVKKLEKELLDPKKDPNGRGIYPLLQLYTQLRETTSELRALTSLTEQADKAVDGILQPLFRDIAQLFTDRIYTVKMAIRPRLDSKLQKVVFDLFDDNTREISPLLQALYAGYVDKLRSLLTEES
jgi:hypothetical protein